MTGSGVSTGEGGGGLVVLEPSRGVKRGPAFIRAVSVYYSSFL